MLYNRNGLLIIFILLFIVLILITHGNSDNSIELEILDEEHSDDEILKEILDIQRKEEEELINEEIQIAIDELEAKEAERIAIEKKKELDEQDRIKQQNDERINKKKQNEKKNKIENKSKTASSNTLKAAKTNTDYSSEEVKSRDRIPSSSNNQGSSGGGSYYGTQRNDQQQHKKKDKKNKHDNNASRMNQKSNDMINHLESKLSDDLQSKAIQDTLLKEQLEQERTQRYERYKIKRQHAYPVETILKIYEDTNTDLYQVLGAHRSIDDSQLKRLYRAKALSIHPDKNPHPDTKVAFDALQDAYDTISSPIKRKQYDVSQHKLRQARRFKLRKFHKWFRDSYDNLISEIQLFLSQVQKKEPIGFLQSMIATKMNLYESFYHMLEHFVLLPTFYDRLCLFHELLWIHKKWILAIPTAVTSKILLA